MKPLRIIGAILFTVVTLAILAAIIATYYFYNLALNPKQSKEIIEQKEQNECEAVSQDTYDYQAWLFNESGYENLYVTSFDGYKLHNYEILNPVQSNRYVIAVHGYNVTAKSMAPFAKYFYDRGYHVILPDLRGHGQSEGDVISMGWYERLDIIQLVNYIVDQNKDAKIVLVGVSMGAATVLMASGEELPGNVVAIIEDCGYTSVWDEFSYQIQQLFSIPEFPILYTTSLFTNFKDGYSFQDASVIEQVKKSTTPTLFIHGSKDTFVPFDMLEKLYQACSAEKQKLVIEGAGHAKSIAVNPTLYKATVNEFLDDYGM